MELKDIRFAFHTLGCKVNIYETEVMEQLVTAAGAELVPFEAQADVYVVNTCSVTNMADRKSRQMLHRAKKTNPDALVCACGCYAQVADAEILKADGVDIIMGSDQKAEIVRIVSDYLNKGLENAVTDVSKAKSFRKMSITGLREHTRADLKVQDGCNQFCSYCIIPYTRGRIRSKMKDDVIREVEDLVKNGIQEFVLTGIHLSSYGRDLENGDDLIGLIEAVSAVPGVKRIRLGSLEPRIVTEEFARRLAGVASVCPHFHLSLQSGAASTLKRMNRHYSPDEYRESCRILRKHFNDPAITTDVIVGFPGETEADFEESLAFVEEIGFYEMHVFKYSRRKGTAADRMPDQIREEVKTGRSKRMIELGERMSHDYRTRRIGSTAEILTEEKAEVNGETCYTGYTREYVRVCVPESAGENRILTGVITEFSDKETLKMTPAT